MSEIIDKIAAERYLRGDEKTMDDVYVRVANAVGKCVESTLKPQYCIDDKYYYNDVYGKWQNRFYQLMKDGIFIPNTPTLSNAGTPNQMLSACFALPVNDSFFDVGGIMDGINNSVRIMKMGGGVGYNFSRLRPAGSTVKSTDGVASGPVSFMGFYNAAVNIVKQGGRRRGAAIGILNVSHPDIKEFITCKANEGDISNLNISVMVTDAFMKDVLQADDMLHIPMNHLFYNQQLFNMIVDGIYNNGEPGVLFYDTINEKNPNKHLYNLETVNPCGEIPIGVDPETGGGEACNLGSINVSKCVDWNYPSNFNWEMLRNIAKDATVFLDTVIEMNEYPTPEIRDMALKTRKIGLGIMGLHDALIMLGYEYDSFDGRMFAKDIMKAIQESAQEMSQKLAIVCGSYPAWTNSEWGKKQMHIRNSTLTCIAPTGTISILADCSSGIEPHYNWVYERKNTVGQTFKICPTIFKIKMLEFIHTLSEKDVRNILYNNFDIIAFDLADEEIVADYKWLLSSQTEEAKGNIYTKLFECIKEECFIKGSIQHIDFIPKETRELFKTALDISWKSHIDMQATLQVYCDNSISKTINMPNSATKEDIREAIIYAWQEGCKGFTMYREGSRNDVVMELKKPIVETCVANGPIKAGEFVTSIDVPENDKYVWTFDDVDDYVHVYPNPGTYPLNITVSPSMPEIPHVRVDRVLPSTCFDVCTGCGDMYVHVAEKDGKIRKVFINNAGNGGCEANTAAIGRLISLGLKHGVPVREVIRQLRKVKCNSCTNNKKAEGKSCADIIGKIMEECIPDDEEKKDDRSSITLSTYKHVYEQLPEASFVKKGKILCPRCHAEMNPDGNCWVCMSCGYSRCG